MTSCLTGAANKLNREMVGRVGVARGIGGNNLPMPVAQKPYKTAPPGELVLTTGMPCPFGRP